MTTRIRAPYEYAQRPPAHHTRWTSGSATEQSSAIARADTATGNIHLYARERVSSSGRSSAEGSTTIAAALGGCFSTANATAQRVYTITFEFNYALQESLRGMRLPDGSHAESDVRAEVFVEVQRASTNVRMGQFALLLAADQELQAPRITDIQPTRRSVSVRAPLAPSEQFRWRFELLATATAEAVSRGSTVRADATIDMREDAAGWHGIRLVQIQLDPDVQPCRPG